VALLRKELDNFEGGAFFGRFHGVFSNLIICIDNTPGKKPS
jgi:hypothetical protein